MYLLIKGTRLSVWETKDINIGGTGLTNINFESIGQVKFIDTKKYFLFSLGKLAETLDPIEKEHVEKLTVQFLIRKKSLIRKAECLKLLLLLRM